MVNENELEQKEVAFWERFHSVPTLIEMERGELI